MRADLKAKGVELEEPKTPPNSLGQGHNPKETPQMYVEKILRNQKRMERTIQLYEENQKKQMESEGKQSNDSEVPALPTKVTIKMTIEPEPEFDISEADAVA